MRSWKAIPRERGVFTYLRNLEGKRHVTQRDKFEGATYGNSTRLKAMKTYYIYPYPTLFSSTSEPLPLLETSCLTFHLLVLQGNALFRRSKHEILSQTTSDLTRENSYDHPGYSFRILVQEHTTRMQTQIFFNNST